MPAATNGHPTNGDYTNGIYSGNAARKANGVRFEDLRLERTISASSGDSERMSPTNTSDPDLAKSVRRRPSPSRRRPSLPLAPPFIVSAPGKTIVYGEHAVVHGKAAIAASIALRSYLLCTTLTKSQRTVSLRFTDIGLNHTWNIADLPWKVFSHPDKKKRYFDMVTSLDKDLVEAMAPFIEPVSANEPPEQRKMHHAAASCFLYLFLSLGSEYSPGCVYALRSAIPVGAGLGSSASVSVCIAGALLVQARALSGPHPDQQSGEAEEQLERINRWAFVGEMLIHGNPSGVDNTVATNGRAVLFQRKDYTKAPSVTVLRDFPELPLLLIDTCQAKSTAAEVAKVAALKKRHPVVVNNTLDAIDSITREVYEKITSEGFDPESRECVEHLGELMSVNHGLLTGLGVSHPRLERIRYLVEDAHIGWTKLTGSGGGGCAITLLKPEAAPTPPVRDVPSTPTGKVEASALQLLEEQLEAEDFKKYHTAMGGDGIGVLYPAVINGEEINQELFLEVEGRDAVEELVGDKYDKEAWKYWRP